ncbi:hypothetical protein ABID23_001388 [Bartonella silvatica]|uniref:Uncharacterized protein n=1 Tax=Bartonella silvatica TaxID=357760 RepID=A0ABV2HII8_9HYPH
MASGQNLASSVTGDITNSQTGLIYAGSNGALKADGILLNDFGAIMAEGDLFFTNADGTGKSLSLVNKAGLIQAGSTPILTENSENVNIGFKKTEGSDRLSDEMSYHKEGGVFSSSKSEHNKIDAIEVVGSTISGGKGIVLESGNDSQIMGSMFMAVRKR